MLEIPYITPGAHEELALSLTTLPSQPIDCANWPEAFGYKPAAHVQMAHDGHNLHLLFTVEERYTRALEGEDGRKVCLDSCVELFIQPSADDPHYYNFEFNAIGTAYAACRTSRKDPRPLPQEVLARIKRNPSLGRAPLAEFEGENHWTLQLTIPREVLIFHPGRSWSGMEVKMNLYKCGDELSLPHYLSWAPITTPSPDFHRPEFFAKARFAK